MKTFLMASLAVAAMASTSFAQTTIESIAFDLTGNVPEICGVYNEDGTSAGGEISFGDLAAKTPDRNIQLRIAKLTYVCNSTGGIDQRFSSENGGALVNIDSSLTQNNRIDYELRVAASGDLGSRGWVKLASPNVRSYSGAGDVLLKGKNANVSIRMGGVATTTDSGIATTTVFAGDYQDTLTLSITAKD